MLGTDQPALSDEARVGAGAPVTGSAAHESEDYWLKNTSCVFPLDWSRQVGIRRFDGRPARSRDGSQLAHERGELTERQALLGIGQCLIRRRVDFYQQAMSSGGARGPCHRRDVASLPGAMARVDDNGQVRSLPDNRDSGQVEKCYEVRGVPSGGLGQPGVKGLGKLTGCPCDRRTVADARATAVASVGGGQVTGAGDCPPAGPGLPLAVFWRSVKDDRPGRPGPERR